ncbi:MAG: hypothetical protein WAK18_00930 [Nocardioidaceae bacterium]
MTTPNDPHRDDDLEGRLRRTLRDGRPALDVESFIADVHRGARGRRRRQVTGGVLATVAIIAGGAYAVTSTGVFDDSSTQAADQGTPTVTSPLPATETGATTSGEPSTDVRGKALSLSATDTEHQYVLLTTGRDGCRAPCAEVDTTADGGQTWHRTAPLDVAPSFPDPTENTVHDVRFANTNDGWVFGGALRSTHDGGASWTRPTLPAKGIVTALESSARFVYASLYDDPTGTSTIVRSPVDRDAWETVDVGGAVGSRLRYVSALAVSSDVVAVLASPTYVSADNQINASTDDGATWNQISPCKLGDWPSSISTSANAVWTLCSGKSASPWVTTNAGTTWTDVPGTFSPGGLVMGRDDSTAVVIDSGAPGISLVTVGNPPERALADRGDFLPIGFTNAATGYLRDFDGNILRTTDSGATWQTYPLP